MPTRVVPHSLLFPLICAFAVPSLAGENTLRAEGSFVLDGDLVAPAIAGESRVCDPLQAEAGASQPSPPPVAAAPSSSAPATVGPPAPNRRPVAFEYGDGYRTRLKIHKYASFATLPLFVAQFAVGQKLYNGDTSDGMRSAHQALVGGTAALFGVNTVTGLWNLREGRKDPSHRTKRMVHGLLMFAADGGFLATGLLTPHERHGARAEFEGNGGTSPSTHRALALSSMGVATVAYVMMLVGR